jgi:hypothetical protein
LTPFYNSKTQKHIEVKQRTKKTFSCTCYLSQLFDEIDVMSGVLIEVLGHAVSSLASFILLFARSSLVTPSTTIKLLFCLVILLKE